MVRLRSRILRLALPLAACAWLLAVPAGASAATIHVDSASNEPDATCGATPGAACESIDAAVARSATGDLLLLAPGDYTGATIDRSVRLEGAQAGISGIARGLDQATRATTIRGTLVLRGSISIDGVEFRGASGPAIRIAAALPGMGATLVANSTFAAIGGAQVVYADAAQPGGITLRDSLFVASADGTGARTAMFVHGELVPGGIGNVLVERNEFRGFAGTTDAAVLDLGGVPGMRIRSNVVVDSGPLLVLSDTDGSVDGARVHDNLGTGFVGPAIHLGGGVTGISFERNRLAGGTGAAIKVSDARGTGRSSSIVARANDISGFPTLVIASGDTLDGALVLRGNRLVADGAGTHVANSTDAGAIDARRNWWGRSSGIDAARLDGEVDATEPLRLVGVDAPAAIVVGGSGVASVRLVAAIGAAPESDAAGFPVTFTTTNATLDAAEVTLAFGTASTLFTGGTTPGSTTTTATLDGERVQATTRILAAGSTVPTGSAEPSVADKAGPKASGFRVAVARSGRLARALSLGFSQVVVTNRAASVRTTYVVSHYTAKLLGLRPRRSPTHEPFVIGKARTRAIAGRRIVTTRIAARPRYAIARYGKRVEVFVHTHVRALDGTTQSSYRRIVLPAAAS